MGDPCVFCKMIRKEIPVTLVYEDEKVIAFNDIHPAAPVHVLLIPKIHLESLEQIPKQDPIVSLLCERAVQIAQKLNLKEGYRLVINQGQNGGQTVFHLHLHLLGRTFL